MGEKNQQGQPINQAAVATQEQIMQTVVNAFQNAGAGQQQSDPYGMLLSEFTTFPGERSYVQHGVGSKKGFDIGPVPYTVSPVSGRILYKSGVVADPTTGEVIFPPGMYRDASTIEGSDEWIRSIQGTWTVKQANTWRKKLASQGYEIAESGGMGYDLLNGLKEYHRMRYLNGGTPLPLAPTTQETREQIRKTVDFQMLKEEAKGWGDAVFGDSLGDEEAEYFAERIVQTMTRLAKKHPEWSMEQLQSGATMRAQKEFVGDEDVSQALNEAEEDEMDETLRSSIVSISQVASI